MFIKRVYHLIFVIVLVALVLPAASHSAQAQAKKVLRWDSGGDPDQLDPQLGNSTFDVALDQALFARLLRYDANTNLIPMIAKEVPTVDNGGISADGKTYTYHLRTDWTWSDGNGVVKAQDVVYAWQRAVDPRLGGSQNLNLDGLLLNADTITNTDPAKIDQTLLDSLGVKALDDFTVQFTLVHAASYWNQLASTWGYSPVRKDNVERKSPSGKALVPASGAWTDPANGTVASSGPFMFTKWVHGRELVFDRNPNYAGDPAKLDEIDFQEGGGSSGARFRAGLVDIVPFSPGELNIVKGYPVLSKALITYPTTCADFLALDNTRPPFNNPDARKAFALAIDRDALIKQTLQGLGQKWLSFLPPSIPGADPSLGADFDYNPAQAKVELAKAGYPNGRGFPSVTLHIEVRTISQGIAPWLLAQLKEVLNVTVLESVESSTTWIKGILNPTVKQKGMYFLGWCPDYQDPSAGNLLSAFGQGGTAGNLDNTVGYANPAFDKAAAAGDSALDPRQAMADYQQAQKILVADQPVAFLYLEWAAVLVSSRVKNLQVNPLDGGEPGSMFWESIDIAS